MNCHPAALISAQSSPPEAWFWWWSPLGSPGFQCFETSADNSLPDSHTNVPSEAMSLSPIQK